MVFVENFTAGKEMPC